MKAEPRYLLILKSLSVEKPIGLKTTLRRKMMHDLPQFTQNLSTLAGTLPHQVTNSSTGHDGRDELLRKKSSHTSPTPIKRRAIETISPPSTPIDVLYIPSLTSHGCLTLTLLHIVSYLTLKLQNSFLPRLHLSTRAP